MNKRRAQVNKEKGNKSLKVIGVIYILTLILFLGMLIYMDVMPTKYVLVIIVLLSLWSVLLVNKLFKNKVKVKMNAVSVILAVISMFIYCISSYYMYKTMDFIDRVGNMQETEEYYVIVRNDSNIKDISSLKDKNIYVLDTDDESYVKSKEELLKKVQVLYKKSKGLHELGENLISKNYGAILISNSQNEIIKDQIDNFATETKILYKITLVVESKQIEEKTNISEEIFNIYISGIDSSGKITNVSRSDANILATVNTNTKKILLTSIPRDYYVKLHSKNAKDKLTHAGVYGINETILTIEDLLDINIEYYVRVNFTTLINMVDVIDGIDVVSDYKFNTHDEQRNKYYYVKGINHLNGKEALAFSRERNSFASGDRERVKNQQKVIEAIIKKVSTSPKILTRYTSMLNSLSNSFQTNIPQTRTTSLIKQQINDMSPWSIETISLDGKGSSESTYTYGSEKLYVMIPDESTINEAKHKINEMLGK